MKTIYDHFDSVVHHPHDFELNSDTNHANPFTVSLSATFVHESGVRIENLPGFFDGDGKWVLRFTPTRVGLWSGFTRSDDPALGEKPLSISAEANTNPGVHGLIRIHPDHRRRLSWSDHTPFLKLGFECDWLFSYHQADEERCFHHIDRLIEHGFDTIVTNLYAHTGFSLLENDDRRPLPLEYVFAPPKIFLFEGENEEPDHERPNIAFYRAFDRLIGGLHQRGVALHLMIQVQNKRVNWPARRSPADDRFWHYVVARYQAFGNVIWDVGKECKNLLKETGSHDYTLERMALIRAADAYGHLVTAHDVVDASAGLNASPDEAADFVSDQVHLKTPDRLNREALRRLRQLDKPYENVESGYELAQEKLKTYTGASTADWQTVLRRTWALCAAGAYANYYYDNTSWDLIKFEPEGEGWPRYRYLVDFLSCLPLDRMSGDNELVERGHCLADPGSAYLVYLDDGGDLIIDLTSVRDLESLSIEWLDIYNGERRAIRVGDQAWSTIADRFRNGHASFLTTIQNPLDDRLSPAAVAIKNNT